MIWALLIVPLISGFALVLQSAMNSELGQVLDGEKFWPVVIANSGGFFCCAVVALFAPGVPLLTAVSNSIEETKKNRLSVLMYTAGFWTSGYLVITVVAAPTLGMGLLFVSVVCGQVLTALAIEKFGLAWSPKKLVTWHKMLGAALVVVGNVLFQIPSVKKMEPISIILIFLSIVGGSFIVVAAAFSRRLGSFFNHPGTVTGFAWVFAWAFFFGACLVLILSLATNHQPPFHEAGPDDWWKFLGGICGAFAMASNCVMPGYIGFAATQGWTVLGQLVTSMLFDSLGLLGADKIKAGPLRISGMFVVFVGVVFVQLGNRAAEKELQRKQQEELENAVTEVTDSESNQKEKDVFKDSSSIAESASDDSSEMEAAS